MLRCLMFLFLFVTPALQAHHSFVAHFDMQSRIELRGTVVDFKLRSPHTSLVLDARAFVDDQPQGEVQRWEVESMAAAGMRRMGISGSTFRPGDSVTVIGNPNRDPDFRFINASTFVLADGSRISYQSSEAYAQADTEAVSQLSGRDRLAGRWSSPGGFANEMLLPLNARGREVWEAYDPKASPANTCEPMNFPDMFNAPYLFDLRFEDDVAVLFNQAWEVERRIPLNGRPVRPRLDGLFGVVLGHMDGETLVLESGGYSPSRWGLGSATQKLGAGRDMPSSIRKSLVERFTVSEDGQSLTYAYTLRDPVYLTESYSDSVTLSRVADDTPLYDYDCELEAAAMFSRTVEDSALDVGEQAGE